MPFHCNHVPQIHIFEGHDRLMKPFQVILSVLLLSISPVNEGIAQKNPDIDSLRIAYVKASHHEKNITSVRLARALLPDSLAVVKSLLERARIADSDYNIAEKAELNNVLALFFWFSRQYDSALHYARLTTLLDTTAVSAELRAEALNNTGTLHSLLGNVDSSIHYAKLALQLDERRSNIAGMAKSHYDLASRYRRLNKYELAARHGINSVKFHEEIKDNFRLINSLNALANIYLDLEDTVNTIKTYYKAISIAENTGDTIRLALVHSNLSAAMLEFGEPKKALLSALKAIELQKAVSYDGFLFSSYFNAAHASAKLDFRSEAESYLTNAWRYAHRQNKIDLADAYYVKAEILLKFGQIDSALYYSTKAEAIARQNNLDVLLYNSLFIQSSIDSIQGNYIDALKKYQLANQLRQNTLNNKHKSRIEELRLIYDIDQKDAQNRLLAQENKAKANVIFNQRLIIFIVILFFTLTALLAWLLNRMRRKLEQQNVVISEKNDQLLELNKTKDKFLSIIAHDLKGPFNALLGLLENLTNEFNSFTDNEKLLLLRSLEKTSQNTYALLVNLLDWARAQKQGITINPTQIEVNQVVEEVFLLLNTRALKKQHQLINDVPKNTSCYFDKNILTSVLINLINNAIKFTPRGGTIAVKWNTNSEGKGVITVEDNGIGIPEAWLTELFELGNQMRRRGTEQETGTGLGLILVKEMLQASGGHIQVQSSEGKGTRFIISLP